MVSFCFVCWLVSGFVEVFMRLVLVWALGSGGEKIGSKKVGSDIRGIAKSGNGKSRGAKKAGS